MQPLHKLAVTISKLVADDNVMLLVYEMEYDLLAEDRVERDVDNTYILGQTCPDASITLTCPEPGVSILWSDKNVTRTHANTDLDQSDDANSSDDQEEEEYEKPSCRVSGFGNIIGSPVC